MRFFVYATLPLLCAVTERDLGRVNLSLEQKLSREPMANYHEHSFSATCFKTATASAACGKVETYRAF